MSKKSVGLNKKAGLWNLLFGGAKAPSKPKSEVLRDPAETIKRPIYGNKLNQEIEKATRYSKAHGIPWRMTDWHKPLKVITETVTDPSGVGAEASFQNATLPSRGGTFPWSPFVRVHKLKGGSTAGRDMNALVGASSDQFLVGPGWTTAMGFPLPDDRAATVPLSVLRKLPAWSAMGYKLRDKGTETNQLLPVNPHDKSIYRRWRDIFNHEITHKVTADKKGEYNAVTKRYTLPWTGITSQYGDQALSRGILPNGVTNATYPEMRPVEAAPPLSALQEWSWLKRGHRFESPEDYRAFVKKFDEAIANPPPGIRRGQWVELVMNAYGMQSEVKRLFRYREAMKRDPDKAMGRLRIKKYDDNNARTVPSFIKNDDLGDAPSTASTEGPLARKLSKTGGLKTPGTPRPLERKPLFGAEPAEGAFKPASLFHVDSSMRAPSAEDMEAERKRLATVKATASNPAYIMLGAPLLGWRRTNQLGRNLVEWAKRTPYDPARGGRLGQYKRMWELAGRDVRSAADAIRKNKLFKDTIMSGRELDQYIKKGVPAVRLYDEARRNHDKAGALKVVGEKLGPDAVSLINTFLKYGIFTASNGAGRAAVGRA